LPPSVFRYLWATTDEAYPVPLEQLKDHLVSSDLSRPDFRTLKGEIAQLVEFGVDLMEQTPQFFNETGKYIGPSLMMLEILHSMIRWISCKNSSSKTQGRNM